jgi:membrane-associated phospholipid phosphatase
MITSGFRPGAKRAVVGAALVAFVSVPGAAFAQDPPKQPPPPGGSGKKVAAAEEQTKPDRNFASALVHNLGDDIKHIPRKNTWYWLATGSVVALAVHPADDNLNDRLGHSDTAKNIFTAGKYMGSLPFLAGASVATYIVGRAKNEGRVKHLGMDLIEATILSEGITQIVKSAVRRDRPIRDDGTRAAGFAFPSGHSSGTFAAATVLQQHLGWKAALPTYSVAAYVAISRLADQRHWASDVVFGAAEGIIIGRSVTWHGRNFYASPMLLPKGGAIMVNVKP